MSVESSIDGLIARLRGMAGGYGEAARQAILDGANALGNGSSYWSPGIGKPPTNRSVDFILNRTPAGSTIRVPKVPAITGMSAYSGAVLGELQPLAEGGGNGQTVDWTGGGSGGGRPTLEPLTPPPYVEHTEPPHIPEFTDQLGKINPATTIPNEVDIGEPEFFDLVIPQVVSVQPLSGSPPDVTPPEFTPLLWDFADGFNTAITLTEPDMGKISQQATQMVEKLSPNLVGLLTRLNAVLVIKDPVFSTAEKVFDSERYQAVEARRTLLHELDAQPSSVTGLPTGGQVFKRFMADMGELDKSIQASEKAYTTQATQEIQHVKWAYKVAIGVITAAINTQANAASLAMEGYKIALDGGLAALSVAVRVSQFLKKWIALYEKYNEIQLERLETKIKILLSKSEPIKFKVASNKLTLAYNSHNMTEEKLVWDWLSLRVRYYKALIDYIKTDITYKKSLLSGYDQKVAAYNAQVKAKNSEYDRLSAYIKGDLAWTDFELGKITAYDAEVALYKADAEKELIAIQAEAQEKKQLVESYQAEIAAKLEYLQAQDDVLRLAVTAITRGYEQEEATAILGVSEQQLSDRREIMQAYLDFQNEQMDIQAEFKDYAIRASQGAAKAQVAVSGASTLSGIASQAYAGFTAVGSKMITEEA